MNVYLIVKRDETGNVYEVRATLAELAIHIDAAQRTGIQILAIIRL